MSLELIYPQNSLIPHRKQGGLRMDTEDLLVIRFNKHPEFSINGKTSLDDEFMYMIAIDPELECLIETDVYRSINLCLTYMQILIKLCIFESQDIETLITEYKPSEFWDSLDPAERRELIEQTLFVQEETEQEALESIGTEKMQENRHARSVCSTWWKGS
jgi:hypothetical protein